MPEGLARVEPEPAPQKPAAAAPAAAAERAERATHAEILGQVRVGLRGATRRAEVHLTPAELGRVSIRLEIKGARVDAVARVESIEAMAALERHLPELRAALGERGLEVGDLDLEFGGDAGDRDRPQPDKEQRFDVRSHGAPEASAADPAAPSTPAARSARAAATGGLDTLA